MAITAGSLFSGVGGFELGFAAAGIEVLWQCEVDPACKDVLGHRFAGVPVYDDVRTVNWDRVERPDVIFGGFPCQDLSVAGRRAGLDGERSGLFFQFARVLDTVRPAIAVIENVPGLLSSAGGRDMAVVLGTLRDIGATDIGWAVLDAQWFGVPQRRRRVFIVCDFAGERASEILALPEGLSRHPAPRRATRQGVAGSIGGGSGERGWRNDLDGNGAFIPTEERVSGPLLERSGKDPASTVDDAALVVNVVSGAVSAKWAKQSGGPAGDGAYNLVTHALTAEGADASEDGGGRETPLVVTFDARNETVTEDATGTLQAKKTGGYSLNYQPVIAIQHAMIGRHDGAGPAAKGEEGLSHKPLASPQQCDNPSSWRDDGTTWTLDSRGEADAIAISIGLGSDPLQAADMAQPVTGRNGDPGVVAFAQNQRGELRTSETAPQLTTGGGKPGEGYAAVFGVADETGYSLRANPSHSGDKGDGGINTTMVAVPEVANTLTDVSGQRGYSTSLDSPNWYPTSMGVRRLTPVECERLMGWPEVRDSVTIEVWNENYCENPKSDAPAGNPNLRSPKPAGNAGSERSCTPVASVGKSSTARHHSDGASVALLVEINFVTRGLSVSTSSGELLFSAPIAEDESSSRSPRQGSDFAQVAARMRTTLARITPSGRVASPESSRRSSPHRSGARFVRLSGREISGSVSDAGESIGGESGRSRSITSAVGESSPNSDSSLRTSCCSVVRAISGYIPAQMWSEPSFVCVVTVVDGHTAMGASGKKMSDAARYRMCGNGVAAPVSRWIAERIVAVLGRGDCTSP